MLTAGARIVGGGEAAPWCPHNRPCPFANNEPLKGGVILVDDEPHRPFLGILGAIESGKPGRGDLPREAQEWAAEFATRLDLRVIVTGEGLGDFHITGSAPSGGAATLQGSPGAFGLASQSPQNRCSWYGSPYMW